jgi:hypothetical protein
MLKGAARDPVTDFESALTFLETEGIEPTNDAAERALRPAAIQRKVSHVF